MHSPLFSRARVQLRNGGEVFLALLDHANLPSSKTNPKRLLERWIGAIRARNSRDDMSKPIQVVLRAYGGWFADVLTSQDRFLAAQYYQTECPAHFRVGTAICQVGFEFADTLASVLDGRSESTSAIQLTHTVATRNQAVSYRRVRDIGSCNMASCELQRFSVALRKQRGCSAGDCPLSFGDCYERHEQKQVDIHLAVDLLSLSGTADKNLHLGLATNDWDLLPAVLQASNRIDRLGSLSLLRTSTTPTYLDGEIKGRGVAIVDIARNGDDE